MRAVQALVDLYQVFSAGLHSPGRPVGNLLFLGPTGSGKTRTVEAAAEIPLGDSCAVIKVDCAEFQHSHEIAKLIGSPPGYLGHRETHPLITQEALAASHREHLKLSFLLFDEIEKASDALWQLLLGMLDKATLTLGDNRPLLYRNLGDGQFEKVADFPELRIHGMAAAWGDYDNDGWLDLVVTGYNTIATLSQRTRPPRASEEFSFAERILDWRVVGRLQPGRVSRSLYLRM